MKNVAAKHAFEDGCDYIVWHDIDMIPEDGTDYSFPSETPIHIATHISQMNYELKYAGHRAAALPLAVYNIIHYMRSCLRNYSGLVGTPQRLNHNSSKIRVNFRAVLNSLDLLYVYTITLDQMVYTETQS